MSTAQDLQNEIFLLREELEEARDERDRLVDERTETLQRHESEVNSIKSNAELSLKTEVNSVRGKLESTIQKLREELDLMYRASNGDSCGWREQTNAHRQSNSIQTKHGIQHDTVTYINDETGETSTTIPPLYEFSIRYKLLEQAESQRKELLQTKEKLKEMRVLEVRLNSLKGENAKMKQRVNSWEKCSCSIINDLKTFEAGFDTLQHNIDARLDTNLIHNSTLPKLSNSIEKVTVYTQKQKQKVISQQNLIRAHEATIRQLKTQCKTLKERVEVLENFMEKEIDMAVAPIQKELHLTSQNLEKEIDGRKTDRVHLAHLWPPGWVLPTLLLKDFTMSDKSDEYIEKEKKLAATIISTIDDGDSITHSNDGGADTVTWIECKDDENNIKFYENTLTKERSFYKPEEKPRINLSIIPFKKVCHAARLVISYMKTKKINNDCDDGEAEVQEKEQQANNYTITNDTSCLLPYDIYTVEELATGEDNWVYNINETTLVSSDNNHNLVQDQESVSSSTTRNHNQENEERQNLSELRHTLYLESSKEEHLVRQLNKTQNTIAKISANILELSEGYQSDVLIDEDDTIKTNDDSIHSSTTIEESVSAADNLTQGTKEQNRIPKQDSDEHVDDINFIDILTNHTLLSGLTEDEDDLCLNNHIQETQDVLLPPSNNKFTNEVKKWLVSIFNEETSCTPGNTNTNIIKNTLRKKEHRGKQDERFGPGNKKKNNNGILSGENTATDCMELIDSVMNDINHLVQDDEYGNIICNSSCVLNLGNVQKIQDYQKSNKTHDVDKRSESEEESDNTPLVVDDNTQQTADTQHNSTLQLNEKLTLHETIFNQLLEESQKLERSLELDHDTYTKHLKENIEETQQNKLKEYKREIASTKNKIARLEGKLNGLKIVPTRPSPPKVVPPLVTYQELSDFVKQTIVVSNDAEKEEPTQTVLSEEGFNIIVVSLRNSQSMEEQVMKQIKDAEETNLLSMEQHEILCTLIQQKNSNLKEQYDDAIKTYSEQMEKFNDSIRLYEEQEKDRKNELLQTHRDLCTLRLEFSFVRSMRLMYEDYIERLESELSDELTRKDDLLKITQRENTKYCKLLLEKIDSKEAVSKAKKSLSFFCSKKRELLEMKISAVGYLERIEYEENRVAKHAFLDEEVRKLRNYLVEEGRRRKHLYFDGHAWCSHKIKRLRAELELTKERSRFCSLLELLRENEKIERETFYTIAVSSDGEFENIIRAVTSSDDEVDKSNPAKYNEGLNILKDKCVEDVAWTDIVNSSVLSKRAKMIQTAKECLKNTYQWRLYSRKRESQTRKISSVFEINDANDNIHHYRCHRNDNNLWLSHAEQQRYQETIEQLNILLRKCMDTIQYQAMVSTEKINSLKSRINLLICKGRLIEESKERDINTLRHTAHESSYVLQGKIRDLEHDLKSTKALFKNRFAELYKSQKVTKESLENELKTLKEDFLNITNLMEAMRYDLSKSRRQKDTLGSELKKVKSSWMEFGNTMREQLRTEQQHSARLELMIAAMREAMKCHREKLAFADQKLFEQKKHYQRMISQHELEELRHNVAIQELGTNVDQLFFFFIERLSNLAGASQDYNNKLRENGAIEVLRALCHVNPCEEVRILAVRSLGNLGWNDSIDIEILKRDTLQTWIEWVQNNVDDSKLSNMLEIDKNSCSNREEEEKEMIRAGLSFRSRRQYVLRKRRRRESPNEVNQLELGSDPTFLSNLFDMCSENYCEARRKYALFTLGIACFQEQNAEIIAQKVDQSASVILDLLKDSNDEIRSSACVLAGNLGLKNIEWKRNIIKGGGMDILISMCKEESDLDIVESASMALTHILTDLPEDMFEFVQRDWVTDMTELIMSESVVSLIDEYQMSCIQANASECLGHMIRYDHESIVRIGQDGMRYLVLLCGSNNILVREKVGLALGNISFHSEYRDLLGSLGAVEALFLLCEKTNEEEEEEDEEIQRNAFWALSNLAWEPLNQARIGKYYAELLSGCKNTMLPSVQINAFCCLGNVVCYNERNRDLLANDSAAIKFILDMSFSVGDYYKDSKQHMYYIQGSALRILLSLTYVYSNVEEKFGITYEVIVINLLNQCKDLSHSYIPKLSGMILVNLCENIDVKRLIIQKDGVEILTSMTKASFASLRQLALCILDELSDLLPKNNEDTNDETKDDQIHNHVPIRELLILCQSEDMNVRKYAFDTLAEEIWMDKSKQQETITEAYAIFNRNDNMCQEDGENKRTIDNNLFYDWIQKNQHDNDVQISVLWTIRNLCYDNSDNKDIIGKNGMIEYLMAICRQKIDLDIYGNTEPTPSSPSNSCSSSSVVEAILTALVNITLNNETNSRKLLEVGSSELIKIANGDTKTKSQNNQKLSKLLLQIIQVYNDNDQSKTIEYQRNNGVTFPPLTCETNTKQ